MKSLKNASLTLFVQKIEKIAKIRFFKRISSQANASKILQCAQSISRIELPLKMMILEKKIFGERAPICKFPGRAPKTSELVRP